MKFSKDLKKYTNFALSFILVTVIIIQTGPSFFSNFKNEGRVLPRTLLKEVQTSTELALPLKGNSIIIFWASWCSPCKVEMNRLSESVGTGKIPADRVLAINSYEDERTIRSFLNKNDYPFLFFAHQGLAEHLNISRTPTTLFVENGTISKMSSGLSLIGIWQAEQLFRLD